MRKRQTPVGIYLSRLQRRVPGRALMLGVVVAAIGVVGLRLSLAENASPEAPASQTPSVSSEEVAAGQIIVKYKPGVDEAQMRNVTAAAEAEEKDDLRQLHAKVLKVPKQERAKALERLKADPRVEYAEPVSVLYPAAVKPNDPIYTQQWALWLTNTDLLWDKNKGADVTVGVIDTGANERPDLAGRLLSGRNFWDNNDDTTDTDGHGTGVASIVTANTNNSSGIAGACWGCHVIPLKASGPGTTNPNTDTVSRAILYAADNGIKLVNISLAAPGIDSSVLEDAVNYAAGKGVLIVAGAGNSTSDEPHIPAKYDSVISVAATSGNDRLESYSTFGSTVDIAASAPHIVVEFNSDNFISSAGTSFASPTVTGIIAVLMSAFPDATPDQLRDTVVSTADPCCDGKIPGGRINAIKAYNKLAGTLNDDTTKPTIQAISPTEGGTASASLVHLSASASDNVGVSKVHIQIDGNPPGIDAAAPFSLPWSPTSFEDGPHSVTFTAFDAAGNSAAVTRNFIVNKASPDTTIPTASITAPTEDATVSGNLQVEAVASDANGIAYVEFWKGDVKVATDVEPPYSYAEDTSKLADGESSIAVRAYDANGNYADDIRRYVIRNSSTPPPTTPPPTTPPPTTPPPGANPKPADINGSGKVDLTDLSILLSNWSKTTVAPDLNSSGKVDLTDLSMLLSKWGTAG